MLGARVAHIASLHSDSSIGLGRAASLNGIWIPSGTHAALVVVSKQVDALELETAGNSACQECAKPGLEAGARLAVCAESLILL